jgi:hypothetical protein
LLNFRAGVLTTGSCKKWGNSFASAQMSNHWSGNRSHYEPSVWAGIKMVAEVAMGAFGKGLSTLLPFAATCFLALDFVLSASRRLTLLRSLTARTQECRMPLAGEYFQNGKQDVDRRLPPGRNARRRGPWKPD